MLQKVVVRCPVPYTIHTSKMLHHKSKAESIKHLWNHDRQKNIENTTTFTYSIIIRCRQFSQFIHNNNNNKMRLNGFHGISCIYVVLCIMPV